MLLEDRLQDLRMTRRTRTFNDVSDSDVIQSIAGDHGLTPAVELTGPTHKVLAQVNQSDLAFLRERARAAGAELWIDGRTLNAKPRTARTAAHAQTRPTAAICASSPHWPTSRTSARASTVSGWDVNGKQASRRKPTRRAVRSELGSDSSGAKILGDAFGERDEIGRAHRAAHQRRGAGRAPRPGTAPQRAASWSGRGLAQPNAKLRVGAPGSSSTDWDRCSTASTTSPTSQHSLRRRDRLPQRVHSRAPRPREARAMNDLDRSRRRHAGPGPRRRRPRRPLVRRLPRARQRHQRSRRPGPREDHAAVVARHRRRAVRSLGAAGHADGRREPRQLVHPRRRRRGAGRLRRRRSAPARTSSADCGTAATRRRSRWTAAGSNFKKVLRSRNGVKVTLDDNDGREQFIAETPGGQKITLKDGPGSIELADSNGNSLKLEASGITITTSASLTMNASTVDGQRVVGHRHRSDHAQLHARRRRQHHQRRRSRPRRTRRARGTSGELRPDHSAARGPHRVDVTRRALGPVQRRHGRGPAPRLPHAGPASLRQRHVYGRADRGDEERAASHGRAPGRSGEVDQAGRRAGAHPPEARPHGPARKGPRHRRPKDRSERGSRAQPTVERRAAARAAQALPPGGATLLRRHRLPGLPRARPPRPPRQYSHERARRLRAADAQRAGYGDQSRPAGLRRTGLRRRRLGSPCPRTRPWKRAKSFI